MNLDVASRLKEARKYNKLTIDEAKNKLRISKASLINYENGITSPTVDLLEQMCILYNVSPNYIIFGRKEVNNQLNSSLAIKAFNLLDLIIEDDISYDQFNRIITIKNEKLKEIFIYCNAALISNKLTKLEIINGLINYISQAT